MPFFFSLVTFITALRCNIQYFLTKRVSEPLVKYKITVTLELKLCQSKFSSGIERQKEAYQGTNITLIFMRPVDLFLIPVILTNFDQFSKRGQLFFVTIFMS